MVILGGLNLHFFPPPLKGANAFLEFVKIPLVTLSLSLRYLVFSGLHCSDFESNMDPVELLVSQPH